MGKSVRIRIQDLREISKNAFSEKKNQKAIKLGLFQVQDSGEYIPSIEEDIQTESEGKRQITVEVLMIHHG